MELGYLAQYALPPDESDACCTLAASRSSAFSRRFGGVAAGAVSFLLHFQGCLFLRVVRRDCPALLLAERGPRLEPLSGDVSVCLVKGFCRAGKQLAFFEIASMSSWFPTWIDAHRPLECRPTAAITSLSFSICGD